MTSSPKAVPAAHTRSDYEPAVPIAWDHVEGQSGGKEPPSHPAFCEVDGLTKASRFAAKTQYEFKVVAHDGQRRLTKHSYRVVGIICWDHLLGSSVDQLDQEFFCKAMYLVKFLNVYHKENAVFVIKQ